MHISINIYFYNTLEICMFHVGNKTKTFKHNKTAP